MTEDTEMDMELDSIFSQLSNSQSQNTQLAKPTSPDIHVHVEDMEQFAIDTSAKLVQKTLEIIDEIKDRACASSDPEDVQALASTVRSAAAAMEAFNKIYISRERNKTAREMKHADIASRKQINQVNNQTKLMMSREDVMKQLFEKAAEVEAEVIENEVED
jgi:hypothetical protein